MTFQDQTDINEVRRAHPSADVSADNSLFSMERSSVLDEFQPLVAVEGEVVVARQERHSRCDSMGDNHVVAGVAVVARLIQL